MTKHILKVIVFTALFLSAQHSSFSQEATVVVEQDSDIEKLLEYKKDIKKTVVVYKIQVFSGNRSSADKALVEFKNAFGDWPVTKEWKTPNYKIWVGNFRSRLEADRALMKIKKKYPNAFIFKPKKDKKN